MTDAARFWDARYAEAGLAYGAAPNDFLVEVADQIPPHARVLCLAEGEGRNAVFLAERGHAVTAVDASAVGLDKARALASSRGVSIATEVVDLAQYAITPSGWDAIVVIWMHLRRELRARVHRDAVRGLRPGGVLVLVAYTPAQLALGTGGPREAALLVDPTDLRGELEALELTRFDVVERVVHEGKYHDGKSAVVQVVARAR